MGNNSATSKPASTEPPYVAPKPRKPSTKLKGLDLGALQAEQHGKKPLGNDEAFTAYIEDAKGKMKSKSTVGGYEEQNNAMPVVDAAHGTNNKKENEKDHFSDFIQNARKKLRTVTRYSSFRRE